MTDRTHAEVDPWDETPVTVPLGLLSVLLDAAERADAARLLGECTIDPCPVCTAMVEIYDAAYPQ